MIIVKYNNYYNIEHSRQNWMVQLSRDKLLRATITVVFMNASAMGNTPMCVIENLNLLMA